MKRLNITKNDLLREIYINLGTSLSFSEKILDYLLDIIIDGLNHNNKVKISGFGTFIILDKTGEKILIINPTNNIFINNKDINYNNLEFFDHIHTTSGNIETVHSIKENVKKYNNTLSIDVENISSFKRN